MQPGAKARARLEAIQLFVSAQEGFLHHVLRVLFVAGHAINQLEEPDAVALDEHTKRVLVACPCPCDRNRIAVFHHSIRRRYS